MIYYFCLPISLTKYYLIKDDYMLDKIDDEPLINNDSCDDDDDGDGGDDDDDDDDEYGRCSFTSNCDVDTVQYSIVKVQ